MFCTPRIKSQPLSVPPDGLVPFSLSVALWLLALDAKRLFCGAKAPTDALQCLRLLGVGYLRLIAKTERQQILRS